MTATPTVVFGLDGAHFELLRSLLDDGELPNVTSVIENGTSGDLESVLPPVTSPNWKAYATGKNPGKIGIFWWENVDVDEQRVYYPSERKHENTEFWELIAEQSPVGVVNVPTTYPPKEVDGFLVAGAPDGKNEGFARPTELERRLRDEFDYIVRKTHRLDNDRSRASEEILDLIDLRFRVARDLYERHDLSFLQVTTFYINSLHHFLWDHEYTREGWRLIDEHLGWFLEKNCNVVLMSDHGSNPIHTVFNVNAWLEQEGYLVTETGIADRLFQAGVTKEKLLAIATELGAKSFVKRWAPRRVLSLIPDETGAINREGKTGSVDWSETEAMASGQGPVYLTKDPDDPGYDELRAEIRDALVSLECPSSEPIADSVRYREDVYSGPYVREAPDLVIDQAEGVHIPGGVGQAETFTSPRTEGWRAENKRHGLFVASGPDFGTGEVAGLSILDLAPTLLHLHDVDVPEDMDGTVRRDVFDPDSDAANREPGRRAVDATQREITRIRSIAKEIEL